jgi:hypothetical protein
MAEINETEIITEDTENQVIDPIANYLKDTIFKKIVTNIISNKIAEENKVLLDGFVDSLANLSPISINITDVFYKTKTYYDPVLNNDESNHIKGVQDKLNQIFMNNFWNVFQKYSKNYIIKHRMEDVIYQYDQLGGIDYNMDFEFFKYMENMFTSEKYMASREFKEKKGTKTSMEFAYKSIWDAKVEGVFREDYFFEFSDQHTMVDIKQGSCINPNPPLCTDPVACECTEPGRIIGTWVISDTISDVVDAKTPFRYKIIGSLMPVFFNTMVRDIAHPVGFDGIYDRIFYTEWVDYFNLFLPVHADKVYVKSLCYEGDCSQPRVDLYISTDGTPSIVEGSLYSVQNELWSYEKWRDFRITKYLFNTGQFLLEYKREALLGLTPKTIIEYYGNKFDTFIQLLTNYDFDNNTGWNHGDRWTLNTLENYAELSTTGTNDLLYQTYNFEDKRYVIELDIIELTGALKITVGEYIFKIVNTGKSIFRFNIYGDQTLDIILEDEIGDSVAKVNSVALYEDLPNTKYFEDYHSAVMMDNFKRLSPVLLTYDIFDLEQAYPDEIGDKLNEDLVLGIDDYPLIGNNIAIGGSGSDNNLYTFKIGCYDPADGPFPPYDTPQGCCEANVPYNPPGWNPGDPCIIAELYSSNPNLQYVKDELQIVNEETNRTMIPLITPQGFDSNWTIVSGDAVITPEGILKQSGSVESIVERTFDICPNDEDVFIIEYAIIRGASGSVNYCDFSFVNGDDTINHTVTLGISELKAGWILNNSNCDDTNKAKLRITLPINYNTNMRDIVIYKY